MRCLLLIFLLISTLAHAAEEPPKALKVDKVFWARIVADLGRSCYTSLERSAACLNGLNQVLRDITGKSVFLLLDSQLNDDFILAKDDVGRALFQLGHLALSELAPAAHARLNTLRGKNLAQYMRVFQVLDERYKGMVESGLLNGEDFRAAFQWTLEHTRDDDQARSLYLSYTTASRRAFDHDPFFRVSVEHPYPVSNPNLPVSISQLQDNFFISRVRPGSQADTAGLVVGMMFEQVGKDKVTPANLDDLMNVFSRDQNQPGIFKTPAGERLTLNKWPEEPPLPGVYDYNFSLNDKRIGVIEILSFSTQNLCASVEKALQKQQKAAVTSLIIDLRGNPGGTVEQARCVGGLFFGRGLQLSHMRNVNPSVQAYDVTTSKDKVLANVPVAILIDGLTASSSELLAGAAQDMNLAWIVGQRSFGKGIAQIIEQAYVNEEMLEGIEIAQTKFRFHFRSGRSPHLVGVEPDFAVSSPVSGLDGESLVARFGDRFGKAFEPPFHIYRQSPLRLRLRGGVAHCVKRQGQTLKADETALRWLEDRQLRQAALVSVCTSAH